jgi:protein-tyrosine-phosphatase
MKILFICKYNRFRSKFAEAYFKKINQNKNIKVQSAGIIKMDVPLTSTEKQRNSYINKKYNLSFKTTSREISSKLLREQDKIIIVANDIPKIIFNGRFWRNKVEIWKIPDEKEANEKNINKSVGVIIKKINKLIKTLK